MYCHCHAMFVSDICDLFQFQCTAASQNIRMNHGNTAGLDQGFKTAREFIYNHILVKIDDVIERETWRDPKSYFQELAQHFDGVAPEYHTLREDGPDHDKTFTVAAYVNGESVATASGHSKQEAQVACAEQAIQLYRKKYAKELPKHEIPKQLCPDWLNSAYPI